MKRVFFSYYYWQLLDVLNIIYYNRENITVIKKEWSKRLDKIQLPEILHAMMIKIPKINSKFFFVNFCK